MPEEDVCGDEHAGGTAQRGSWKKVTRPSQRREMAEKAVALRGVSVALACRTFEVSETCYRYSARLNDENEQIADDLFVCKTVALHSLVLSMGQSLLQNGIFQRGNVTASIVSLN